MYNKFFKNVLDAVDEGSLNQRDRIKASHLTRPRDVLGGPDCHELLLHDSIDVLSLPNCPLASLAIPDLILVIVSNTIDFALKTCQDHFRKVRVVRQSLGFVAQRLACQLKALKEDASVQRRSNVEHRLVFFLRQDDRVLGMTGSV